MYRDAAVKRGSLGVLSLLKSVMGKISCLQQSAYLEWDKFACVLREVVIHFFPI